MSESIEIHGKEYATSTELARRVSYTSDYIGRLAREKKINAAQVHRRWYIQTDSLMAFIDTSELNKKERSDALKTQRNKERAVHKKEKSKQRKQDIAHSSVVFAQAFVVLMCGISMGFLGWTTLHQNLMAGDMAHGAQIVAQDIMQAVTGYDVQNNNTSTYSTTVHMTASALSAIFEK